MNKFSLYSMDLIVQGPHYTVQRPPDMDKFNLYSMDLMLQDSSVKYKGPSRHG